MATEMLCRIQDWSQAPENVKALEDQQDHDEMWVTWIVHPFLHFLLPLWYPFNLAKMQSIGYHNLSVVSGTIQASGSKKVAPICYLRILFKLAKLQCDQSRASDEKFTLHKPQPLIC